MNQISPLDAQAARSARLGQNHGYRIAGDVACLNAEFAIARGGEQAAKQWALQLWACDRPYVGGALSGTKIAETLLDVPQANTQSPDQPQYCYAETFARLPTGDREYAMVLVLASRSANAREESESQEVHDFANYPAREHFQVPGLRGAVDLQPSADKQSVTLRVERIENPREPENLSGSLSLELWALDTAYTGGQFAGQPLAGVELGQLAGQQALEQVTHTLVLTPEAAAHLAAGVTLMLREWTATGYVTRDYRGLSGRAVAPAKSASQPASALKAVPTPAVNAAPNAVKVASSVAPVSVAPSAAKVASPVAAVNGVNGANGTSVVAAAAMHGTPIAAKGASAVAAVRSAVASALQPASKSDVPVAAAKQPEAATKSAAEDLTTGLVSIQHATLEQLSEVPGLNRKLASEIIKARPFRSLDELAHVRGIGDASFRRLRTLLSL